MRILFCKWGFANEGIIENTLRDMGHFVRAFQMDELPGDGIEAEVNCLVHSAGEYHAEVLFTVDYFTNMCYSMTEFERKEESV